MPHTCWLTLPSGPSVPKILLCFIINFWCKVDICREYNGLYIVKVLLVKCCNRLADCGRRLQMNKTYAIPMLRDITTSNRNSASRKNNHFVCSFLFAYPVLQTEQPQRRWGSKPSLRRCTSHDQMNRGRVANSSEKIARRQRRDISPSLTS